MRIATWNINSVNQRVPNLVAWLKAREPDVVCLQEIKCVDANFPAEPFEALGYNVAVSGQKTFNGVAILSKLPLEDVSRGLPGDPSDEQARFIAATISTPSSRRCARPDPLTVRPAKRSLFRGDAPGH